MIKHVLAFICFSLCLNLSAQVRITGTVIDFGTGEGLPGVSVYIEGTTTGTVTDVDGNYQIQADPGDVLNFSFVGFKTVKEVVDSRTTIDVSLESDITQLGEIVVTALGIERDKKAVGFAVQSLEGEELVEAREPNVLNNLAGKISGVQINNTGNGPTGSTVIYIRGFKSITRNNEPLYVIDGVPIVNRFEGAGVADNSSTGAFDGGVGINQVNPDDIESMTVLKGPSAAALYGNRGLNGVVLITTKSGKTGKGIGVSFNANVMFDTPLKLYDNMQHEYGQGNNGDYLYGANGSWGPRAEGQIVDNYWTNFGEAPLTIEEDDLRDFLQTGVTQTYSVAADGGNDKTTFRVSYTRYDNEGLIPNTSLERNLASIKAQHKFSDRLNVEGRLSYTNEEAFNRPWLSGSLRNVFFNYITQPRSIGMEDQRNFRRPNGFQNLWDTTAFTTSANPHWLVNEGYNQDETNRYITLARVEYNITDWLKVQLRHGLDYQVRQEERLNPWGMGTPTNSPGHDSDFVISTRTISEANADVLLTANKSFGDLNVNFSVGANRRDGEESFLGGRTAEFTEDPRGLISLNTPSTEDRFRGNNRLTRIRINSVYAFANLAYKDYLFLDLTTRTDWSSTQDPDNSDITYPGVSTSLIVSELFDDIGANFPSTISYLKLRGGYAEAGNFLLPSQLINTFEIGEFDGGIIRANNPDALRSPNLVPEKSKSLEFGFDISLFLNRLSLDATYYHTRTVNQIIDVPVNNRVGSGRQTVNIGRMDNRGIELQLSAIPIQLPNSFEWTLTGNFTRNTNELVDIGSQFDNTVIGLNSFGLVNVVARKDSLVSEFGVISGTDFAYTEDGRLIVNDDGTPRVDQEDQNKPLGNILPDWQLGINNRFTYKGVYLSFLIDIRKGGDIYSGSLATMHANGNAEGTLPFREGGLVVDGVTVDEEGNVTGENETEINAQQYWDVAAGVTSQFMYKASFVKLREVTLGYSLPRRWLQDTFINSVRISAVGRNLWLIDSDIPGIDPESLTATNNAAAFELAPYPTTRSFGFNLNVQF